ncbi:MAG: oligosaccharide flippase family protein, partial [Candidatus Cloacimonadota bacterium]|nr:oligosaccharide flippase family protein [Candidatus Cloacimonadota bacterium]
KKNLFLLFASEGISKAISFFVIIYVARNLGAHEFGYWAYASSLLVFFQLFSSFGLDIYAMVESNKDLSKRSFIISNIVFMKSVLFATSFFLMLVLLFWFDVNTKVTTLLVVLSIGSYVASFSPVWFYQIVGEFDTISIIKLLQALFYSICLYFLFQYSVEIVWMGYAYLFSYSMVFLLYARKFLKFFTFDKIDIKKWSVILKSAFFLGAALFMTEIYGSMDKVMIGTFLPKYYAGWYEAAYKIYTLVLISFGLVWTVFAPKVANKSLKEYRNFTYVILLIALFSSLIMIVAHNLLVDFFYGAGYEPTKSLFIWFGISAIVVAFSYMFSAPLALFSKEKEWFSIVLYSAVINFILNLLLIPFFDLQGAVFATIISELYVAIAAYRVIKKEIPLSFSPASIV